MPSNSVGDRVEWNRAVPYLVFNAAALAFVFVYPPRAADVVLCAALYAVRMFAVGGILHRYFSHRSYSTSRAFQFVLALLATTTMQQGILWWVSQHRHHHRYSDQPEDFHSPTQHGFLWSHQLWSFTARAQTTDMDSVKDLSVFPELGWLSRNWAVPHLALVGVLFLCGGLRAVEWGFMVSSVLVWQVSFGVNSFAHLIGRRRFATPDTSRNSLILAIVSLGDGWHNNHHHYPGSMRAGFYWWEVDFTAYLIRALGWFGLVWNIHPVPARILERVAIGPRSGVRAPRPQATLP
jgi:stearoyl-CoA desaturase (delta-9 desaturase)